jgi:hypothetical protein
LCCIGSRTRTTITRERSSCKRGAGEICELDDDSDRTKFSSSHDFEELTVHLVHSEIVHPDDGKVTELGLAFLDKRDIRACLLRSGPRGSTQNSV